MAVLVAEYRVKDFAAFRDVFDSFGATRVERGATGHRLLRSTDDPDVVTVVMEFPSTGAARAFAADPERLQALDRAGVIERADEVMEEVDAATY